MAALDLTFSAPKSVSVLFAVAGGGVSHALVQAHERAVDSGGCVSGAGGVPDPSRSRRRGSGLGRGVRRGGYRHRLSRAGDPQLHTHVVVANLTRADGRYTALDAHALYEHKSAAGAVYRAVLRAEVRDRLPWVSWTPDGSRAVRDRRRARRGCCGISRSGERRSSSRAASSPAQRRTAAVAGADAGDRARHPPTQDDAGVDGARWREDARARAAEHGFGPREYRALKTWPRAAVGPSFEAVVAWLSGPDGLTGTHNTFARRHALAEIAGEFTDGVRLSDLERATDKYLEHPSVRSLPPSDAGEPRFTTEELLSCERAILDGAVRRQRTRTAVSPTDIVDAAVAGSQPALNDDQAAAVRAIASSGNGVDTVQALAGTGKTTMLRTLAGCLPSGWLSGHRGRADGTRGTRAT